MKASPRRERSATAKSSELLDWCRSIRPAICRLSDGYRSIYSEGESLPHYQAVALMLEERYGDPVLARAAFLHGVSTEDLRRLPAAKIGSTVLSVLGERERLRALDLQDPYLLERLLSLVLPSIHDARSVVLFVLEQLHHLDPTGEIGRWTAAFHVQPADLPPGLPDGPCYLQRKWPEERVASFYRNVVAPTGKFFGLWHERNVIEDATLLFSNRPRFLELLEFARRETDESTGEAARLRRLVGASLEGLEPPGGVRWGWRHIASIDRNLETKPISWRRQIHHAGFVNVFCGDSRRCYLALHDLHGRFPYRPTEVRDYIGQIRVDGYKAIHTVLVPSGSSGVEAEAIAVRLIPTSGAWPGFNRPGQCQLESIGGLLSTAAAMDLRVLTPDGNSVGLPPGSTVLNFAYAVNHKWIAHLTGATINRRPVGVLHPLRPGDIVWLDISDRPHPLPAGWERQVPAGTASKIRRMFRQYYRPELRRQGRQWLRERLLELGVEIPEEDHELDDYLEESAASSRHFPTDRLPTSRWLLTHLGSLAAQLQGDETYFTCSLSETLAQKIVVGTAALIRATRTITLHDLRLPEELKTRLSSVVICDSCQPDCNNFMVGTTDDDNILTLHSIDAPCAGGGGIPLSRMRRSTRTQYFVVQTTNRIGVAAEILDVFYRQQINLRDLAAIQLGANWAIVRVQTGFINSRKVEILERELKRIRGVTRLVGPNDRRVDALEAQLPPRRTFSAASWQKPAPYYCGNDITDDAYFYGMDNQLGALRRAYEETVDRKNSRGKAIWILGPRRAGKTSLIQAFLRDLPLTAFLPCATVYFEAAEGQTWSEAEQEIGRSLIEQALIVAGRSGQVLEIPESWDLPSLISTIRSSLDGSVVLVIDEAVGLLAGAHRSGESKQVQKFGSTMQNRAGALVVWVGPEAPARYLDTAMGQILQKAEALKVEPLTREAVESLLRAEKLAPRYDIEISRKLLQEIFESTGGNPFWVSHLGREMWGLASKGRKGPVRYTREIFLKAKDAVFELRVPFLDRIQIERPGRVALSRRVLEILAGPGGKSRRLPTLQLAEIHERLDLEGTFTSEDLHEILEDLQATGSTVSASIDNCRYWRISCPMLADYLAYAGP